MKRVASGPAPSLSVFIGQSALLLPLALLGPWYVGLSAADGRPGTSTSAR